MIRLNIRCDVNDYETWRERFDAFHASGRPAERGVRQSAVYHDDANPNNVLITLDFDDTETAQAYVMNPENKQVLEAQGVQADGMLMSLAEVE